MAEVTPQTCCSNEHDQHSINPDQARKRIVKLISPITAWEMCPLRDALGRILHQDIICAIAVPPHDNSAMDGYALHGSDIHTETFSLEQVGIALAGQPYTGKVTKGQCIRIMTGAVMPKDCDTVVMQEHVLAEGSKITIHGKHKLAQNVRYAGDDLKIGDAVLTGGQQITPADLGLMASLGIAEVKVTRKVRVAFFSTGDELCSIGAPLAAGQIYDSNRYTLYGMLKRLDVDIVDMGVVADQKQALREALQLAAEQADVIITTGGVSVGDADYVKDVLAELGSVDFWKIAMKPGRPLAFGTINDTLFFGLPGNPVAVMVTFYQFAMPALQQLAGQSSRPDHIININCVSQIRKRPGRTEFQRGILFKDEYGQTHVKTTGEQGSGVLRSMSIANCFILLDEACDGIEPNTLVSVQPFAGLI